MYPLLALLATVALAAVTPGGAPASPPDAGDSPVVVESAPSGPEHSGERRPERRPLRRVRYRIGQQGAVGNDLGAFRRSVTATLADDRGWSNGGQVRFVAARREAELRIWLASPAEVAAAHPSCDALFSCRVGADVYINITRWREGATGKWPQPLSNYRQYVVNHEVGHWLGLEHRDCPTAGAPAPVMLQQTIGLDGCKANTWPLPRELRRMRQHLPSP